MTKSLRGKVVLVTGAGGFLATNLIRRLIAEGARVHGLLRPGSVCWRAKSAELVVHDVDLRDAMALRRVISGLRPTHIFHLAAHGVLHDRNGGGRREVVETNVVGTWNLLEAAAELDNVQVVQTGGSSEYGHNTEPLREQTSLEPVTLYGATKAAATLLSRQIARERGLPLVILRPFSIYGPWESPERLIPTLILAALRGSAVSLTPPGLRHDYIFVDDVVDACLAASQVHLPAGEIINIGSAQQWTNEAVVELVQQLTGSELNVEYGTFPARQADTAHWVADIRKASQLLSWSPVRDLPSGLKSTLDWFHQNHSVYPVR